MNIVSNNPSHIVSVDTANAQATDQGNFSANFKILNIATLRNPLEAAGSGQ